ncbi:MAG: hypothetical protein AAGB26_13225 [Planctomycetota bacterium]
MYFIQTYLRGWKVVFTTVFSIVVWQIAIILPVFPFMILFPDQLEGKADGSTMLWLVLGVLLLLWAPFVSAKVGSLEFAKQ